MADSQRKTANLFDEEYPNLGRTLRYKPINVGNGDFTLSSDIPPTATTAQLFLLAGNVSTGASSAINGVYNGLSRTTTSIDGYVTIAYVHYDTHANLTDYNTMLNEGTTPLPYEPYWLHSLRKLGTATDTLTTLPADLYADGTNATVSLVGDMSQTGTPTPTTPIQPSETGERTGNLFDVSKETKNTYITQYNVTSTSTVTNLSDYININTTSITLSGSRTTDLQNQNDRAYCFYTDNKTYIKGATYPADISTPVTITVPNNAAYIRFAYDKSFEGAVMLNTGSTALPYEPYGYKLDIKSANTTTPVYLGEVESTRIIGKYEFTGNESWSLSGSGYFYSTNAFSNYNHKLVSKISTKWSHYIAGTNNSNGQHLPNGYACLYCHATSAIASEVYIRDETYSTAEDFKTYLQQQYAAGTPVTVWYVLVTPTTGIVNEPLRKIGNYADSVIATNIPTTAGGIEFDVLTTLKPSEVSLSYTGWHDASVGEWDGSQWQ